MAFYENERFVYDEQGRLYQSVDERGRSTRYSYDSRGNITAKEVYDPNDPLQFYTCFISYSTKDQDFADRLYADLKNAGISCWFAPHNIKAGRKLHEQIDEAIRVYQRLLLILSAHSMESEWVKSEIAHARQREVRENRQVLFPIAIVPFTNIREWSCFDADTGKDTAREIREYFIPDFNDWKNEASYRPTLDRLIGDLRAK